MCMGILKPVEELEAKDEGHGVGANSGLSILPSSSLQTEIRDGTILVGLFSS